MLVSKLRRGSNLQEIRNLLYYTALPSRTSVLAARTVAVGAREERLALTFNHKEKTYERHDARRYSDSGLGSETRV